MHFHVEHIGLAAREPVTMKDWYERCLNARLVRVLSEAPAAFLLELPGGLLLEIYKADAVLRETRDNKLAGWRHLAVRVNSLESAKKELEQRGVVFRENVKPAGGGGRVLFFNDPEGNLFHLVERPDNWVAFETSDMDHFST